MFKEIGYAYATSNYAARLGRKAQGCYFIEVKRAALDADAIEVLGPYADIWAAERAALNLPHAWAPYTKRAPAIGIALDSKGREYLTLNGIAARSTPFGCQIDIESNCGRYRASVSVDEFNAALASARAAAA